MHARSAIRFAVGSFVVASTLLGLSTCSNVPAGGGGLEVTVVLESGVKSKCVLVKSASGADTRSSMPMVVGNKTELHVAVVADGLKPPTTVQAFGFSDEGCSTAVPGEQSEAAGANFTVPVSHVTLTLKPAGQTDGGVNPDGGAGDGGSDGGIDQDNDGYPLGQDCDDTNPAVHPGATESCANGLDDDCNGSRDCMDSVCAGMSCAGGGTCTGGNCLQANETICDDGMDNDGDSLIDCADPSCLSQVCSDGNGCTTGDRCVADGGCEKTGDVSCMSPPNGCFDMGGTCNPDGGTCSYPANTASCNDTLGCTTGDVCSMGVCSGTPKTCASPPTTCFAQTGACGEPAGTCTYAPIPAGQGTCTDNDNCTTGDTCAGDGGCAGTPVTCTPTQCQMNNGCSAGGACLFSPKTGSACDAGTGAAATCDSSANCNAVPTLFPFVPSNFTEAQLPAMASATLTVGCNITINTSGTPTMMTNSCGQSLPPFTIITQAGGGEAVLFRLASMTVNSSQTLTLTGNRPAIFAVTGNISVDNTGSNLGRIVANNFDNSADCGGGYGAALRSGGGGGAFGLDGGNGGGGDGGIGGAFNGTLTLTPLRGGCPGGATAGSTLGGAGGGALQLTAAGTLTVTGRITAPGRGGNGGTSSGGGGSGGGSGGAILLEAATLTLTSGNGSSITANGGGGGEGGDNGNSTGGDGSPGTETTTAASGGNGTNGGNGGAGGAVGSAAGNGQTGGGGDGFGGGGGAVGRIRLNSVNACTKTISFSPNPSGNSNCP